MVSILRERQGQIEGCKGFVKSCTRGHVIQINSGASFSTPHKRTLEHAARESQWVKKSMGLGPKDGESKSKVQKE